MELTNSLAEIERLREYPAEIRFRMLTNLLRWLRNPVMRRVFGRALRRKLKAVVTVCGGGCIDQLVSALTLSKDPRFSKEILLYLSALPEEEVERSDICIHLFKTALGYPSVKQGMAVCLLAINSCFAATGP